MTTARNSIPDADYWRERLRAASELLILLDSQSEVDLLTRLQAHLEFGLIQRYLSASDDRQAVEHLGMALDCGCTLALARVCARRGNGFYIELRHAGRFWRLPGRDNDFGWPYWLTTFSLALLMRDDRVLKVLATAECVDACALPGDQVDPFWPFLCGGLAALYQRDATAIDLLDDAIGLLPESQVIDPPLLHQVYRPTMAFAQAIAAGDGAAAQAALGAALQGKDDYYRTQPDAGGDPLILFDLALSGLAAEAERRGQLSLPTSNWLLSAFERLQAIGEVVCIYPVLSILDAAEAEWMMQNEGYVRHDRSVVAKDDAGRLIAHYRAHDAPGIPIGELAFELLDADRDRPFDGSHAPPALDVGELLHRAEQFASTPLVDGSGREYFDLPQALEAVDLALRYLAAMGGGFKVESLHSRVGRQLYEQEPGRFRYERLLVYRNALARQAGVSHLAEVDPEPGAASDARTQAFALIEQLKPLLLPLLQQIALDSSGEVLRQLVPGEADYGRAFTGEAVEVARQHYRDWWPENLTPPVIEASDKIDVYLAPAGLLAEENELSYFFPRGYRKVASWLDPHRIWVCWKYYSPGQAGGISMNGLVWLDDHWAWFPKPYRLAGRLARH